MAALIYFRVVCDRFCITIPELSVTTQITGIVKSRIFAHCPLSLFWGYSLIVLSCMEACFVSLLSLEYEKCQSYLTPGI